MFSEISYILVILCDSNYNIIILYLFSKLLFNDIQFVWRPTRELENIGIDALQHLDWALHCFDYLRLLLSFVYILSRCLFMKAPGSQLYVYKISDRLALAVRTINVK